MPKTYNQNESLPNDLAKEKETELTWWEKALIMRPALDYKKEDFIEAEKILARLGDEKAKEALQIFEDSMNVKSAIYTEAKRAREIGLAAGEFSKLATYFNRKNMIMKLNLNYEEYLDQRME